MTTRRRTSAYVGVGLAAAVIGGATGLSSGAGAGTGPPAFAATAAAQGTHVVLTVPGAPLSDTPFDGGGPTAQVGLDSIGNSTGYASFPDPGPVVVSLPGLAAGLVASGAFGLPPLDVPSLPQYPLFVSSDTFNPEASVGDGPYALHAASTSEESTAEGTAGLDLTGLGNGALVTATASAEVIDDTMTVTADIDIQGFAIGPLTIGQIHSSATLRLDGSGTITPSSTLTISGARIGGLAFDLTPTGLELGGTPVPLPIPDVLAALLTATGVNLEIEPGETLTDGITAPALRITLPFDPGSLGTGPGSATIVLGDASVHINAPMPRSPATPPPSDPPSTPASTGTGVTAAPTVSRPSGPTIGSTPIAAAPTAPATATASGPTTPVAAEPVSLLVFDIASLYLTVAVLGGLAALSGQLFRLLGVRRPWI